MVDLSKVTTKDIEEYDALIKGVGNVKFARKANRYAIAATPSSQERSLQILCANPQAFFGKSPSSI